MSNGNKPKAGRKVKSKEEKPSSSAQEVASEGEVVPPPPAGDKLQKVLAAEGFGSRREMERVIEQGEVTVNGKKASLGDRVKAGDTVIARGKKFSVPSAHEQEIRVILYHKPEGQITSRSDPDGRPTVFQNLPHLESGRWVSVGRLDFNTSGLLLFTNNGELANRLMHPSANIDREYLARVQGDVDDEMIKRLKDGVHLEDGPAKFTDIRPSARHGTSDKNGSNSWYYCTVMEGRNREVRRLWESQEVRVSRLKRVRFGSVFIPSYVRVGQWLEFEHKDIADLCITAGLEPPRKPKFKSDKRDSKDRRIRKLKNRGPQNTRRSSAKRSGPK